MFLLVACKAGAPEAVNTFVDWLVLKETCKEDSCFQLISHEDEQSQELPTQGFYHFEGLKAEGDLEFMESGWGL